MADVLISSKELFDRLCHEEQMLKRLGLHGQAAGLREAITILIRVSVDAQQQKPATPHS